jgi:hypothetical protein
MGELGDEVVSQACIPDVGSHEGWCPRPQVEQVWAGPDAVLEVPGDVSATDGVSRATVTLLAGVSLVLGCWLFCALAPQRDQAAAGSVQGQHGS